MPGETNGRVTTREFYDVQLKTQEQITDMERRVLDKLEPLSSIVIQVETNKEEIDKLRDKSNIADVVSTFLSAIFAVVAGWVGTR